MEFFTAEGAARGEAGPGNAGLLKKQHLEMSVKNADETVTKNGAISHFFPTSNYNYSDSQQRQKDASPKTNVAANKTVMFSNSPKKSKLEEIMRNRSRILMKAETKRGKGGKN